MISKKMLFCSILLLCTFAFIFLSGEFIARIFIKENKLPLPPPLSTIDPYAANPYMLGMRPFLFFHIPGSRYIQSRSYYSVEYNINSAGFRGPAIHPKQKDEHRLIIIGDSITEGHGNNFNDTFSYKLGKKAKQYKWEVLNLGVQGASPIYFAANIKRYMSADPDFAIIVMFENDLYDDRIQEQSYFSKPVLDQPEKLLINKTDNMFFLSDWSRLCLLLQRTANKTNQTYLEKIIRQNIEIEINNKEQKELNKMSPWLVAPSMFDKQWNMSRKYLDYTISEFKKKDVPVYLVYMSFGALSPSLDKAYALHAKTFNKKIKTWAKTNDIPFLSLVPLIQKLLKDLPPTDLMIKDDGHPTARTHEIIANIVWEWLSTKNN